MTKKELKSLLKPMVRECLAEVFAEIHLESIVENVVSKNTKIMQSKLMSNVPSPPKHTGIGMGSKQRRSMNESALRAQLGVSADEWQAVYGDTIQRNPSLMTESFQESEESGAEMMQEEVPEEMLQEVGLLRDYSKFFQRG